MAKPPTPTKKPISPTASGGGEVDAVLARQATDSHASPPARAQAFEALMRRHEQDVLRFLKTRLDGGWAEAEDSCQEVWLKVHRHLSRFDGRNFRAWVFRIAANQALDHHRTQANKPVNQSLAPQGDGGDASDPADPRDPSEERFLAEEQRRVILARCLEASLSPLERAVVQAKLAGQRSRDMTRMTKPEATADQVDQIFHRAKRKLTQCAETSSS